MPGKNEFTEVVLEMLAEVEVLRKESLKRPSIPFMMKEVTATQAREHFKQMGEDEREGYIQQVGVDNVLRLFKGLPQRRA